MRRVYPRVGGGTHLAGAAFQARSGLSPRGRGNRPAERFGQLVLGSIPAWAGEPGPGPLAGRQGRVYPRVGGGTPIMPTTISTEWGLSPRGRGNRGDNFPIVGPGGSIPAWAGEPPSEPTAKPPAQVYPRVGGGTGWLPPMESNERGLSPRGRGNRTRHDSTAAQTRSIPAWAGEPLEDRMSSRRTYARGEYC